MLDSNNLEALESQIYAELKAGANSIKNAFTLLSQIERLGLWKAKADSFEEYVQKFKQMMVSDLDVSRRHIDRLLAAGKVANILGLENYQETHLRDLTRLKEPEDIKKAYVMAEGFAQQSKQSLAPKHIKKAVATVGQHLRSRSDARKATPSDREIEEVLAKLKKISPHLPDEKKREILLILTQTP